MANATKKTVTKEIITVEFTEQEVLAMLEVFRFVGGCPYNSGRRNIDSVIGCFKEIGYETDLFKSSCVTVIKGREGLFFKDDDENHK